MTGDSPHPQTDQTQLLPFPATHPTIRQPKCLVTHTDSCVCEHIIHLLWLTSLASQTCPGVAITISASSSASLRSQNCRSKIDLLSVPDRLRFKRTAKLPLLSLEAVKPPNHHLGKYRYHHEHISPSESLIRARQLCATRHPDFNHH